MPIRGRRAIGTVGLYALAGVIALVAFLLFAIFFPALLLSLLFFVAAIFVFIYFKGHPYGIWIGLALIIVAALFGAVQVGQTASLSVVHAL